MVDKPESMEREYEMLHKEIETNRVGDADKKLDSLRAPKGVELKCIRRTKLMLP